MQSRRSSPMKASTWKSPSALRAMTKTRAKEAITSIVRLPKPNTTNLSKPCSARSASNSARLKRPVDQLRQDNLAGSLYNLVGFQTTLQFPEPKRVFRLIPGLECAEFVRHGQMHRNTFLVSPKLLRPTLQFNQREDLLFAGQITGVEGYMGNIATGLLAGLNAARIHKGREPLALPRATMLGALCYYVTHADLKDFQPMKTNFGILPPLDDPDGLSQRERAKAYADRAALELERFLAACDDQT